MTKMTEKRKEVRARIDELLAAGSTSDLMEYCRTLADEVFEDKDTPGSVTGVVVVEIERALKLVERPTEEDAKAVEGLSAHLIELMRADMESDDRPRGDMLDDLDLLYLAIEKTDEFIESEDAPIEAKIALIGTTTQAITLATDKCMISEECTEEAEAACDELMAECARLRRTSMRLQDTINEKEGYLDRNMFRGYGTKEIEFKTFME